MDEELAQRVADGVNTETTRRQYADRVRLQINPLLGSHLDLRRSGAAVERPYRQGDIYALLGVTVGC